MIIDSLENINLYNGLGSRIKSALNYLKETDFGKVENGKYEIEGKDVYAAVSRYQTKPVDEGKWEAHKDYIDVQFIASGEENIGHSLLDKMTPKTEYNPEKDVQFLNGEGQFIKAERNNFLILFPTDAHMPGIKVTAPADVTKVVVKVRV